MSKFTDAIKAEQGNRRSPPIGRIATFEVTDGLLDYPYHREYWIGVRLRVKATVPENGKHALAHAMDSSRRALCEEMFGEFRESLCRIEVALMDYDTDKARELLNKLRQQMFDF